MNDLYTPSYSAEVIDERQDFQEQVVVVECLRALRLNRDNLYGSSSREDFRIVGRVLDLNWRTVQSHYVNRCKVASKFGRHALYNIGDLAEEFISWARKSGKKFDECTKKEICDAVNCGNYGTYRQQYHDKLREEVRRHLEPPESWSGRNDSTGLSKLLRFINRTTRFCLVTVFHFTLDVVARALIRAKLRGVCVVVFVDRKAAWTKNAAPVINSLIRAGISVFEPGDAGMVHTKQILADSTFVTGSHNLSASAYGNPLLGTRPTNREHSKSSNCWSNWKQEAQLFWNDVENGVLIRDEKPVTNAVVTSLEYHRHSDNVVDRSIDDLLDSYLESIYDLVCTYDYPLDSLDAADFDAEAPETHGTASHEEEAPASQIASLPRRQVCYSDNDRAQILAWLHRHGDNIPMALDRFKPELHSLTKLTLKRWLKAPAQRLSEHTLYTDNEIFTVLQWHRDNSSTLAATAWYFRARFPEFSHLSTRAVGRWLKDPRFTTRRTTI